MSNFASLPPSHPLPLCLDQVENYTQVSLPYLSPADKHRRTVHTNYYVVGDTNPNPDPKGMIVDLEPR